MLVAVGGAVGSALGVMVLRKPSPKRVLAIAAVACCTLGAALRAYPDSAVLSALLGFGVFGSASSMVVAAFPSQERLSGETPSSTLLTSAKWLAIYCVLGVAFATVGYMLASVGYAVDVKTR